MSDAPSAIPFRSHFCQPPSTLRSSVPAMYDLEVRLQPIFFFCATSTPVGNSSPFKNRRGDAKRRAEMCMLLFFFTPFTLVTHSYEFLDEMLGRAPFSWRSIFRLSRRPPFWTRASFFLLWLATFMFEN